MENRFNNRDFEQFVKQNADQYRMFPSENVWKGIHNTLHTRRRWFGIGLSLLILTTGVVTWVMLSSSEKNNIIVNTTPQKIILQAEKELVPDVVLIAPKAGTKSSFITSDKMQTSLFVNNKIAEQGTENISEQAAIIYNDPAPVTKVETAHLPESIVKTTAPTKQEVHSKTIRTPVVPVLVNNYPPSAISNSDNMGTVPIVSEEKVTAKSDNYPFSIESVINSYIYVKKRGKTSFQVYIIPTISYRELKENKPFINSAQNASNNTNYTYFSDINSLVTHKPDIGLQLGFTGGYPLSKNLKLIGGLQFNISKYDIQAYNHTSEVTSIALRNSVGGANTVYTMSNYRNGAGYKANWLHNLYFSVSAPIGLELKLIGSGKSYLGISGTVQPTYVLRNKAYLISTDYKNYAEVPSLTRKWNINTGFEMFAGYSTGKLKWRVGPQVRYQVMSSFIKKYPVQEHLFDFGLKLGVMLNK